MDSVTGHVDVEETHVRQFTTSCLDGRGRVRDLRTDLEPSALERQAHARARRRMVVRNEHANGLCHGITTSICVPLSGAEVAIAASAAVLGLMVALVARPPLWIAAVIVGAFAIFHGHAHGAELPAGADAVAYFIGFVVATGLLHLTGIAFGLTVRWPAGRICVRGVGAAIACVGIVFLWRLA